MKQCANYDRRRLSYFVAVAEEGHFTYAADELGVAQSRVSTGIRSLEEVLGVKLFERTSRKVELTDTGRALLPAAKLLLRGMDEVDQTLAAVSGVLRGTLRVGTLQCADQTDLYHALHRFTRDHPEVHIAVTQGPSARLLDELRDHQLEVALVTWPADEAPDGVELRPVRRETLHLAVGPHHRLAKLGGPVCLRALREERFVDFPLGWGARLWADRACRAAGLDDRSSIELTDLRAALALVAQGTGVAVTPVFRSLAHVGEVVYLPFREPVPAMELQLALPADGPANPAGRAFLAELDRLGTDGTPNDPS